MNIDREHIFRFNDRIYCISIERVDYCNPLYIRMPVTHVCSPALMSVRPAANTFSPNTPIPYPNTFLITPRVRTLTLTPGRKFTASFCVCARNRNALRHTLSAYGTKHSISKAVLITYTYSVGQTGYKCLCPKSSIYIA